MSEPSLSFTRERVHPVTKLIGLSLVSISLMVLDTRYAAVQQVKSVVATALQPLQWVANQPVHLYEYSRSFLQSQNKLLDENQRLREENMRLQALSNQLHAQAKELKELHLLQRLQAHGIEASTTAQIISNSKDPLADKLIINRGSHHNLQVGDAVIDQNGLIGQITQVQPFSSELTLLTHSQMVIPVMVARTGVRSLLYGNGNEVSLRYFPVDADLQKDDVLVTSGLDSVYPVGMPVAKVTAVQRASGTPYYRTTVLPLAAVNSSKYVLVLPQTELPPSISQPAAQTASAP